MDTPNARPWLGRYERPLPIRSRGAFHLVSATRSSDAKACVVVVPSPFAGRAPAAEVFEEIERVHGLLDHPIIPRVTARGRAGRIPYLELDCDATMDGVEVHERLEDGLCRVPLAFADGFITSLLDGMTSAHAVTDALRGRAVCVGHLSMANVLFARSGRFFLVGYGHNFPIEPAEDLADAWTPVFAAPEVLRGEVPSPAGDYAALLLLARSLLPMVDLGPTVTRLLDTRPGPADAALLDHVRWVDRHILAPPAHLRRSVAEAEASMARLRALCGVMPDPDGFVEYLRRVLDR